MYLYSIFDTKVLYTKINSNKQTRIHRVYMKNQTVINHLKQRSGKVSKSITEKLCLYFRFKNSHIFV